ncbi:MAG: lipoprotein [Pseudomonadota bacterium]
MLIAKQILVSALVLGACMSTLTGCGQTGSLYLPPPPKPAKPAASAPLATTGISYIFYS